MIALLLAFGAAQAWSAEPVSEPAHEPAGVPADVETFDRAPVLLWSAALPGTPPSTATRSEPGSPVVHGDRIYVGYSGQSALLVLSRGDGRLVGQFPARAPVASPPLVRDGKVWFSDTAGYTYCYLLDQLNKPTPTPAWSHYSGAPIVSGLTESDGGLLFANVDDVVFALDAATGALRWRHAHHLDASRSGSLELFGAAPPIVVDGEVWVGFSDGFLVGMSASTGAEDRNVVIGEGSYPDVIAPAYADSSQGGTLVAAGFSGPLVSVDPNTRVVRWRVDAGTASAMLQQDGVLYVGGSDGKMRAVVVRTGEVRWTWDPKVGGTIGEPVWTKAGLLVAAGEGAVYLVDAATGSTLWTFDPGVLVNGVAARPTVVGRNAYIVTNAGVLYALRVPQENVTTTVPWVSTRP